MKNIKRGIRNDFDNIPYKTKDEVLSEIGIINKAKKPIIRINALKLIPAIIISIILISLGTTLVLATDSEEKIVEQLQQIFNIEPDNKPKKIERRESRTDEFSYLLDDRLDTEGSGAYYYRSVKDIVADKGEDLYYPNYAPYTNAEFAFVIHNSRGENISFQIEYAVENLEIFWILVGSTHLNSAYDPTAEPYESHGTIFYISQYRKEGPNGYGGHFVEGILEGSNYSFFATDIEEAKLIIDSLEKAE